VLALVCAVLAAGCGPEEDAGEADQPSLTPGTPSGKGVGAEGAGPDGAGPGRFEAGAAWPEGVTSTGTGHAFHFTDVAAEAGITCRNVSGSLDKKWIIEAKGGGIGWFDSDGDGFLDAYVISGSAFEPLEPAPYNHLYRNRGDGTFEDATARSGLGDPSWSMGCSAGDYDGDGDLDLYVTNYGPNRLFENRGDGTFADVTDRAGVGDPHWGTGAAWADYDGDGDLDLYSSNFVQFDPELRPGDTMKFCMWHGVQVFYGPEAYDGDHDVLYRNNGDGTFTEVSQAAGTASEKAYNGFTAVFCDFSNDGLLDLYVADDTTPNLYYVNQGDGLFRNSSMRSGASLNEDGEVQAGMGVAVGDYDADGDFDFFVTHFADDYNTLYRNEGGRFFTDVAYMAGVADVSIPYVGWGTEFYDFDHDGDEDLFVANGHVYPAVDLHDLGTKYAQRNHVLENEDGRFRDVSSLAGPGLTVRKVSRGAAFGDYDRDGDVDILIQNVDDTPTLLRNDSRDGNWVMVAVRSQGLNRFGVGARLVLEAGGRRQMREIRAGSSFLSMSQLEAHFGLADADRVDRLEVRWPSGQVREFDDVPVNHFLTVHEDGRLEAQLPTSAR